MPYFPPDFARRVSEALPNIVTALLIFVFSWYLAKILARLIEKVLLRRNIEAGATHLLADILRWAVIVLGTITALQRFFDVTAFLAGLGIIGFAIGFGLQNIMQNFISGIILFVQQPFKVGESVGIAGFDGTILKIGLRATEMKTLDGRIVFLPNADVLSQPIINYTQANYRRVELPIGVSYDANPDTVRNIILREIKNAPGYADLPEPQVLFHTFAASSIDLNLFFWVDTSIASPLVAKDVALTRIKKAFEKLDIEIPYPIQTIKMPEKKSKPRKTK